MSECCFIFSIAVSLYHKQFTTAWMEVPQLYLSDFKKRRVVTVCSTLSYRYETVCKHSSNGFSSFPIAGDVWFSLKNTTYRNNSCVALEDIGEGDDALFCKTNLIDCYQPPALGNWVFPNGTRVLDKGDQWDFYRTGGQMLMGLNRRRGGEDGIYRCEIPDSMNVTQTAYIGLYPTNTSIGE